MEFSLKGVEFSSLENNKVIAYLMQEHHSSLATHQLASSSRVHSMEERGLDLSFLKF
jgi:hypothetical protein